MKTIKKIVSKFRDRTVKGIVWSLIGQVVKQIVAFVIIVILARLLSPKEFGLIAMVTVITGFANIFTEMGLSAALIHKNDIHQDQLSTVFWFNIFVGVVLTSIFMLASPLIARFYNEPIIKPLTMIIAITFFTGSLSILQNTLMTKSLDFKKLAIIENISVAIAGLIAIIFALFGFGVWALAIQVVLVSCISLVLMWTLSEWRPKLIFNSKSLKGLIKYSANLLGSQTLNYWVRNVDNLLIGRYLGTIALGNYGRAYSVMLFPLTNISHVVSRVMFPSFSIIQDNKERMKQIYIQVTCSIAFVTFPFMLGLFMSVKSFVMAVFGTQWSGMVPILQVFCLLGMVQSVQTLVGNIYMSQGRTDIQFKIGLFLKMNIVLWIIIGLKWGVVGVAFGYMIASFMNVYPSFFFAGRLINLTFTEMLKNLSGVLYCSLVMSLGIWIVGIYLPLGIMDWQVLLIKIFTGVFIYVSLIILFRLKAYKDLRNLIAEYAKRVGRG